jgi:hypothetical protein
LLTVSRIFMNVANRVLWRMVIILKANKVNLFVSSVLFVFWYHSPNLLDPPRTWTKHNGMGPLKVKFTFTICRCLLHNSFSRLSSWCKEHTRKYLKYKSYQLICSSIVPRCTFVVRVASKKLD